MQDGTGFADVFGIIAHCDYPNLDTTELISSLTEISGWAISYFSIEAVELFIDGISAGTAEYGSPRPDVGRVYSQIPDSVESGFRFVLDTSRLEDGEHELRLRIGDRKARVAILSGRILVDNAGWSGVVRTAERIVPEQVPLFLYQEHIAMYIFAGQAVQGKRVLDLGCGVGYGAQYLSLQGARCVVGIDNVEEVIGYACHRYRKKGTLSYTIGDVRALPFQKASFDVVVGFEILEHLADPPKLLSEARRVLSKEGLFFVSTPNATVEVLVEEPSRYHLHEFSVEELVLLLREFFPSVRVYGQSHLAGWAFQEIDEKRARIEDVATMDSGLVRGKEHPVSLLGLCSAKKIHVGGPCLVQTHSGTSIGPEAARPVLAEKEIKEITEMREEVRGIRADLGERDTKIEALQGKITDRDKRIETLGAQLAGTAEELQATRSRLERIESSSGWALFEHTGRLLHRIAPTGTRRGRLVDLVDVALQMWRREGSRALWRKLVSFVRRGRLPPERTIYFSLEYPALRAGLLSELSGLVWIQGWALSPSGIAEVGVYCDGEPLGRASYGLLRQDVAEHYPLISNSVESGFRFSWDTMGVGNKVHRLKVEVRNADGYTAEVEGQVEVVNLQTPYDRWLAQHRVTASLSRWMRESSGRLAHQPLMSLILVVEECHPEQLLATMQALLQQAYPFWELRVSMGSDLSSELRDQIERVMKGDARLKIHCCDGNTATQSWWDEALSQTSGEFVAFVELGDILQPDALFEVACQLNLDPALDLIYSDHDHIADDGSRWGPFFKSGWSPDLLMSMDYVGRSCMIRKRLVEEAGGIRTRFGGARYYDLLLRVTERTTNVGHIAKVLWSQPEKLSQDHQAGDDMDKFALEEALQRRAIDGHVISLSRPQTYRLKRGVQGCPKVSIIIPSTLKLELLKPCLESIATNTSYSNYEVLIVDNSRGKNPEGIEYLASLNQRAMRLAEPFSWSRLNNYAVDETTGEYLVFLNDDTEVISSDWLEAMLEHAQRPEVGVVGASLLFPDGTIQHGGMFLVDYGGGAAHEFVHLPADAPGYLGLLTVQRNCSAVTGACMMVRRRVFLELGGFDESMRLAASDVDFCLRAREKGYLVVWTPHARLYHHEQATRKGLPEYEDHEHFWGRWRETLERGDPYHNVNVKTSPHFAIDPEPILVEYAGLLPIDPADVQRILIVKLDHIGDVVLSLPAIRRLGDKFPRAEITAVVGSWARPIVEREGALDRILTYDFFQADSSLPPRELNTEEKGRISRMLQEFAFDLALDLRKQGETREFLRLSGAPYTVGYWTGAQDDWLTIGPQWDPDVAFQSPRQHITDQFIQLVDAIPGPERHSSGIDLPVGEDERHRALSKLGESLQSDAGILIGVHPGVGNRTRQWPSEHFARLADKLVERLNARVLFFGGDSDIDLIEEIRSEMKNDAVSLAGHLSLREFIAAVERCQLFIGNTSGPMHMAAARGVTTLGIFGGVVDPREWAPRGSHAATIRLATHCSPCYLGRPSDCPRNLECLTRLPAEKVWQAVCRLLLAEGHRLPAGAI
jgi:ADP-heptose:LPS heptosyltransferase/GT2 family glycosyltransferase/2-polyprenyl-3-methyl-5-hydroxy-6-metoxy-1,4-benzoquinol methylase